MNKNHDKATQVIKFDSRLTVEFKRIDDLHDVFLKWKTSQKHRTSIFLSCAWIFSWINVINKFSVIYSLSFYDKNKTHVGMAFLTKTKILRRKFFRIIQFSLNESEKKGEKFIIEHNNILHVPELANDIYYSLCDFLANAGISVDEIRLNALNIKNIPDLKLLCKQFKLKYIETEISKAYYTDISKFHFKPDSYLACLSKNKREQIRRSIKYFNQFGEQNIEIAANKSKAIDYFKELGILHQQYWTGKGQQGSFSNQNWIEFHKHLINNYFNKVQLIRISFGDHILGYLYNLIDHDSAYSIQSGFNYTTDKNDRPGLISHYLITNYYISEQLVKYDYLAGESQYKQSLSTEHDIFCWCVIQKKSIKSTIENMLVKIVRFLKII